MNKSIAITLSIVFGAAVLLAAGYWFLDAGYHHHSTRKLSGGDLTDQ